MSVSLSKSLVEPLSVLLIGPYPPPFGGLAVQIQLWQRTLAQRGHSSLVLNIGESRTQPIDEVLPTFGYLDFIRKLWKFSLQGYVLHLVTTGHSRKSWLSAWACAIIGRMHRNGSVLVFGSGDAPAFVNGRRGINRLLVAWTLCVASHIVCRNVRMQRACLDAGVASERISIIPGFIGIDASELPPLTAPIHAFVSSHRTVIGATVSGPKTGELLPEYGIQLLVQAFGILRRAYPSLGLLVIGADDSARQQMNVPPELASALYFTGPLPHDAVLATMSRLTVFARPTSTDGDSISIREALALGVPVVASQTDFRPGGVVTFPIGSVEALTARLSEALSAMAEGVRPAPQQDDSSVSRLLDIYHRCRADSFIPAGPRDLGAGHKTPDARIG